MPVKDGRVGRIPDSRRRRREQIIAPWSPNALGIGVRHSASLASVAYPTANKAFLYPFKIEQDFTVKEAWMESVANGAGVHVDIGIYDHAYGKIATIGSTAWTSSSSIQVFTLTQALTAGRYFAALASDSTGMGNKVLKSGSGDGVLFRLFGAVAATTSFVLPATITPIAYSDDFLPIFGFSGVAAL